MANVHKRVAENVAGDFFVDATCIDCDVSKIFLTHRDDVADAERFARHFGARRIIDSRELDSQPGSEIVLTGDAPTDLGDGFLAIPTPGHTAGHLCLLAEGRFLFTGNHLFWDRDNQRLAGFRDFCDSWPTLIESMRLLARYSFEWVLPGHGERVYFRRDEMRSQMDRMIAAFVTES